MLGSRAVGLLQDLSRTEELIQYNEPGVQAVLGEIASLEKELEHLRTVDLPDDIIAPSLLVQHAAIRRNKRCLLAYHSSRCDRIEAVRWRGAGRDSSDQLERMNRREVDYFNAYARVLTSYIEATGIDVTADVQPPKSGHLVTVRALQNCGLLVTSKGTVDVGVDQVHIMWRQDAEALVLRGWLLEVAAL